MRAPMSLHLLLSLSRLNHWRHMQVRVLLTGWTAEISQEIRHNIYWFAAGELGPRSRYAGTLGSLFKALAMAAESPSHTHCLVPRNGHRFTQGALNLSAVSN